MSIHYIDTRLRSGSNDPVYIRITSPDSLRAELSGIFSRGESLEADRVAHIAKHIRMDLVARAPHVPSLELITSIPLGQAITEACRNQDLEPLTEGQARLFAAYRNTHLNRKAPDQVFSLEKLALAKIDGDPSLIKAYKASGLPSLQRASEWDRWITTDAVTPAPKTYPEGSYHEFADKLAEYQATNERNYWIRQNCTIS